MTRRITLASYALLGVVLLTTRTYGLDRSYWHDEITSVTDYIRRGPREIISGDYIPNNHELFNLLGWVTASAVGESELALRLWSVVPFFVGVALVVVWLHFRVSKLTAILFLGLATLSPLLLDLTRQARGYGLAFLAMAVLIVAALEAERTASTWAIVAACVAGVAGTWTLPNFGLAFVATIAVLLTSPQLRTRVAVGGAASLVAIAAWYAPHVDDLLESSQQRFGEPIPWYGLITSPVEQVVAPAMLWIDGSALTTDLTRLPLVAALALVIVASPLLRDPRPAMILGSGVMLTMLVLWAAQVYLSPRFVSYLLVPLFVLLASGLAHLLTSGTTRPTLRAALALAMLGLVAIAFTSQARPVLALPREAHRDAAAVIQEESSDGRPLVYSYRPSDLEYYLRTTVEALPTAAVRPRVCGAENPVVYATQPFGVTPVDLPCARRKGVRRYRLEQYTRGGEIVVWVVPPG